MHRKSLLRRRSFIGVGLAGGVALWADRLSATTKPGRAKNILFIFEQGGISQMDTFDPKPNAPSEQRSPYKPISTSVPGIQFTELCRKTARIAHKLSVVRSMYHKDGGVNGHANGTRYALSGSVAEGPLEMPDMGSIVSHVTGSPCAYLPAYIMVPGNHEQNAQSKHGFLPPSSKALKTGGRDLSDPNWSVPNLGLISGVGEGRLNDRRDLLSNLNVGMPPAANARAKTQIELSEQAANLLTNSMTREAFRIQDEPNAIKEKYGRGHRGQCYLLGRRLIERGVRFVTVDVREPETAATPGGFNMNWDHHDLIYTEGSCGTVRDKAGGEGRYGIAHWVMMGSTDQAFAALIDDLDERGLLDETLVVFGSEFGRSPQLNKFQGREHWAHAFSYLFAGAGVPGGQIIGATDRDGGYVADKPYLPEDLAATIYEKLGIDRGQPIYTASRPIFLAHGSKPIEGLM